MIPEIQAEAASYLRDCVGADPIETHISAVYVGAGTVWKMKKAVRLPFLDFTDLETRHTLLRRELELNAPAAPGLYRDVAAIVRNAAGLEITTTPQAPAVEWVLRMARIPKGDFLDVIAAEGRLDSALLRDLADAIALYHVALSPIRLEDPVAVMDDVARGNVASAREAGLPVAQVAAWEAAIMPALAARAGWQEARNRDGYIRRAHGDLHLGNLCLWQGRPVPFDALEFDETLARIDLGYDLAFLLMDLDQRVGRAAANLVLSRYIGRTGDTGLLAGLPPFLSLRAMVRAHVARSSNKAGWEGYLAAASAYLDPPPPLLVAIAGLPGSGKTTLAQALAPSLGAAPGALVVRSDEVRKRLHGVAPEQKLPPSAYSPAANQATDAALCAQAAQALAAGHAVVLDATFMDPKLRGAVEDLARAAGVRFLGAWLNVPTAELERRITDRHDDASDATLAVLRSVIARDPGARTWLEVAATDRETALGTLRAAIA